jgi:hypothetical protein
VFALTSNKVTDFNDDSSLLRYILNYGNNWFYDTCPRAQSYNFFYVRNIRIFVKARVFVSGMSFQPSLMFVDKARSLL